MARTTTTSFFHGFRPGFLLLDPPAERPDRGTGRSSSGDSHDRRGGPIRSKNRHHQELHRKNMEDDEEDNPPPQQSPPTHQQQQQQQQQQPQRPQCMEEPPNPFVPNGARPRPLPPRPCAHREGGHNQTKKSPPDNDGPGDQGPAAVTSVPPLQSSSALLLLERDDEDEGPRPPTSPFWCGIGEGSSPDSQSVGGIATTTATSPPAAAVVQSWLWHDNDENDTVDAPEEMGATFAAVAGERSNGVGAAGGRVDDVPEEPAALRSKPRSPAAPTLTPPIAPPPTPPSSLGWTSPSDWASFHAILRRFAVADSGGDDDKCRWDRFVEEYVAGDSARWAWEEACGSDGEAASHRRRHPRAWRRHLGLALLRHGRHRPDMDPPLPGGIDWLEAVLERESPCGQRLASALPPLLDGFLPRLVDLVEDAIPRRTVLAQRAAEAAVRLIDAASTAAATSPSSPPSTGNGDSRRMLRDAVARSGLILYRLWDAQRHWYAGEPHGGTSRCRIAVLHEWKRIYSEFATAGNRESATERWVAELRGCTAVEEPSGGDGVEGLGGLAQTMGLSKVPFTCSSMEIALAAVHSATPPNDADVCMVWKGFLAWLGQKRSHLHKADDGHARLLSASIDWYSKLDNLPLVSLAATVIEILWGAVFGEQSDDSTSRILESAPSIHRLIGACQHSSDGDDGIRRRHAELVATAIVVTGSDASVLLAEPEHFAVDVLALLLHAADRGGATAGSGSGSRRSDTVARLLLSKFGVWSSVPRLMTEDANLFGACTPSIVSDLVGLALESLGGSDAGVVVRSLVGTLLHQSSPTEYQDEMVPNLIDAMVQHDDLRKADREDSDTAVSTLCVTLGPQWRARLLESTPEFFSLALVEIGKGMFRRPANLVPLILFGALIGGPMDYPKDAHHTPYMKHATLQLLHLALPCLTTPVPPSTDCTAVNPTLARISPLLLLRRIPHQFYRSLTNQLDGEASAHLSDLIEQMSLRLGLKASDEAFAPDERRLAAEICALALPMDALYRSICLPSFNQLIPETRGSDWEEITIEYPNRTTRAALYAVCCTLSNVDDAENGAAFLRVSGLVLSLLRHDSSTLGSQDEESLQLQAGCIDFLALCLQRLASSNKFKFNVGEPGFSTIGTFASCEKEISFSEALQQLYHAMKVIACEGSTWMVARPASDGGQSHSIVRHFSVPERVFVWNSILLAGKRCSSDLLRLQRFFISFVPWVIDWGSAGEMDKEARHPLCITAALQVVLLFSTPFAPSPQVIASTLNHVTVNKVLSWAMSIVRMKDDAFEQAELLHEARTSALRLLLLLLASFAHGGDNCSILREQQVFEIVGVLDSISCHGRDSDLRGLAKQVLNLIG